MTQPEPLPPDHKKRNRNLLILTLIFFLIAIGVFCYWFLYGRFHEYTDDAYVTGNLVSLTPQVASSVVTLYADNTDLVHEGQLIVTLDPTDYKIALDEQMAQLAKTAQEVAKLIQDVEQYRADIRLKKAELKQMSFDLENRRGLIEGGAISKQELEQAHTNVEVAKAAVQVAEAQWKSATALVGSYTLYNHPLIIEAKERVRKAYLSLIRCRVLAPATGYVAKRSAQVGDLAVPGRPLLEIIPLDQIWVDANYKETQLKKMRIGQPVEMTADLYGRSVKFPGKVVGVLPGTGSVFALLPPENATGNWIKVVQRLAVRIAFDKPKWDKNPLLLGLSMKVTVDLKNQEGSILTSAVSEKPVYETSIYDREEMLQPLEKIMDYLIRGSGTLESRTP